MSEAQLIVPRRNFLIRALGFTAAGAALPVPVVAMPSAADRLAHHLKGVETALGDLFPASQVHVRGNCLDGAHSLLCPESRSPACIMVTAGLRPDRPREG